MDKDEMWEKLLQMGVSEETLQIVTDINGYSEEMMCLIYYMRHLEIGTLII